MSFPLKEWSLLWARAGVGNALLNILGGLDKANEGGIIYRGKSLKNFSGGDFDNYRNTYCGFIFQEYNLLPELNIADNLALSVNRLNNLNAVYGE